MPVKIGSMLDERYRITARIGHGGMAEVYEAHDIITRKTVAIKLIREDVMANPENVIRFSNEATIAASLNHPNIVRVLNNGIYEGKPYMAIEYVKGQCLNDVLSFRGALPIHEAISVMLQLTSALMCAHSHNVIHRDVKPNNLFLMPDGTIKLSDFGIAESSVLKLKEGKKNEIIGSVHYMAPEISRGEPASSKSDIYAAGVTFFELITGHLPFTGNDPVTIAVSHIKERFPSPKKYMPSCPKEIERIINKAVAKNPKARYKNANEFHEDLLMIKNNPALMEEKKSFIAKLFGFK